MDILNDIILGTYHPIWRSIAVNDKNIETIEKSNPDILKNIVYIHENFHWYQLNTSSIGNLISLYPFFHKKIVSFLIESPKLFNRNLTVVKPLMQNPDSHKNEIDATHNDLEAINNMCEFFLETMSFEMFSKKGNEYNQSLFSICDMYLSYTKEILENKYDNITYLNMVKNNREFWDKEDNYKYVFLTKDTPLLGFKDLIECSARIVEIKYYNDLVSKYSILGLDKTIDNEYFYDKNYFRPLEYIKFIFDDSDQDVINDFLLLAIHISINPSIAPFFCTLWNEHNSISDIHPGMRFIKICKYVKDKYISILNAMKNDNLYFDIIDSLNWITDIELHSDLENNFGDTYKKVKEIDNKSDFIDNSKIYDIEYLIYKFYLNTKLKSKYTRYFIDPTLYLSDYSKYQIIKEIDSIIHCPVYFNDDINKFQVNTSGIKFDSVDSKGNLQNLDSTTKIKTDNLSQEFIFFIEKGFFYILDNQLLFSDDKEFDLSILDQFDINIEFKNDLIKYYESERKIQIT